MPLPLLVRCLPGSDIVGLNIGVELVLELGDKLFDACVLTGSHIVVIEFFPVVACNAVVNLRAILVVHVQDARADTLDIRSVEREVQERVDAGSLLQRFQIGIVVGIGAVVDERVLAGADDPSLDAVAVVRRGAGADIAGGMVPSAFLV